MVGIALVMMAVAVPNAVSQYRQYRLTSTAVGLANFLQRCRYDSIRLNTSVTCYYTPAPAGFTFWADDNNNFIADATESQYFFPGDLQLNPAGAPGPASTNAPAAVVPAAGVGAATGITFTPRGGVFPAGSAYIFSIGYPAPAGADNYGYRAITISPLGKTKVWGASKGTTWWNEI